MNTAGLTEVLTAPAPAATAGPRFRELDSMRGLAALIVVFHHFEWMWMFQETQTVNARTVLLYPLFAGHECVILFFLLSGFVLSLPCLRGHGQPYSLFMLRRVLRIYCPYLFGLALSVAGNAVWHGQLGVSWWANLTWSEPVSWHSIVQPILMLGNYPMSRFNTSFWSLVEEMRISVIFPFLFLAVRNMTTRLAILTAAACTLMVRFTDSLGGEWAGWLSTLEYVTVFICGILMAMHLARLGARYRQMSGMRRWTVAVFSAGLFGFSHEVLHQIPGEWRILPWHIQEWPVIVGSAGLMLIGLESRTARALLNSAVPRFLGRISYSLYLVHGTVLFALAFLLMHRVSTLVAFLIYLPATVLLSLVFCIGIEEPFVRLGRQLSLAWAK